MPCAHFSLPNNYVGCNHVCRLPAPLSKPFKNFFHLYKNVYESAIFQIQLRDRVTTLYTVHTLQQVVGFTKEFIIQPIKFT